jgi:hypothetical protein
MWNNYRSSLWMQYGFRDAFNLALGWYDTDVIGIDQGPMVIMIENYLNGGVWIRFMKNPDVQRGLQAAGFQPVTGAAEQPVPTDYALSQNYPNPFNPSTRISYQLGAAGHVRLQVFDLLGREVATLVDDTQTAGGYTVNFDGGRLASGVYVCRLGSRAFTATRTMILVK